MKNLKQPRKIEFDGNHKNDSLLIGNFGDGTINAFNPVSGEFEGKLLDANGAPLWIDGLWALSFGSNSANSGSAIELYFTAGPGEENDGLFGKIVPVAAEQRGNRKESLSP